MAVTLPGDTAGRDGCRHRGEDEESGCRQEPQARPQGREAGDHLQVLGDEEVDAAHRDGGEEHGDQQEDHNGYREEEDRAPPEDFQHGAADDRTQGDADGEARGPDADGGATFLGVLEHWGSSSASTAMCRRPSSSITTPGRGSDSPRRPRRRAEKPNFPRTSSSYCCARTESPTRWIRRSGTNCVRRTPTTRRPWPTRSSPPPPQMRRATATTPPSWSCCVEVTNPPSSATDRPRGHDPAAGTADFPGQAGRRHRQRAPPES